MTDATAALVLGASGGLAQAIITELMSDPEIDSVVAVSSKSVPEHLAGASNLLWIKTEYTEPAMARVVEQLQPFSGRITRVVICPGLLHSDTVWPEKRFEDIDADLLRAVFQANKVVPSLSLKLLHWVLKGKQRCVVAALSARVGSIGDNYLGGWEGKAVCGVYTRDIADAKAEKVNQFAWAYLNLLPC